MMSSRCRVDLLATRTTPGGRIARRASLKNAGRSSWHLKQLCCRSLGIETWISRQAMRAQPFSAGLSLRFSKSNRPILVHDAGCPIRSIAARGDCTGVPSKSERLTSLTSSRQKPDPKRFAKTLSAVAESVNNQSPFYHHFPPVRVHFLERVFFDRTGSTITITSTNASPGCVHDSASTFSLDYIVKLIGSIPFHRCLAFVSRFRRGDHRLIAS
jgi:hypothetical protein